MADLTGYTAMTDVHGGATASKLVNKYLEIVSDSLTGTTRLIQRIGDQVVLTAEHPPDIVATACKLNRATLDKHHFLSIHAGIHYGSVFIENENLFGSTINIAARIMNMAEHGQVLCSAQIVDKCDSLSIASFKYLGKFALKNVLNELELFAIIFAPSDMNWQTDPVCRMQVNLNQSIHSCLFEDREFHFCSEKCENMFRENPRFFLNRL